MAGGGGDTEKSLEQTPTWAVAMVCMVFVVFSLLVERGIFSFGRYLMRNKQKELYHTVEVIRNELMLLGFVSLFLTVFQPKIASICMPEHWDHHMLPCAYRPPATTPPTSRRRRLQEEEGEPAYSANCSAGRVQVISAEGLHQLHIFIFVLAVVHVLYSCLTVLLGILQVHSWKRWESETREENHRTVDVALGKKSHKYASSDFVKKRASYSFLKETRTGWNLDSYFYCFFRQFGRPIYKHDYLCLRLGFIAEHKLTPNYNFHSYIRRTMEQDFKIVVGISWYLWAFVCLFLLMDIYGWYTYFWIAFIPTLTVLFVGMKLQQIITSLALEVMGGVEKKSFGKRVAKVERVVAEKMLDDNLKPNTIHPIKPRDSLFWFNRPRLQLYLVHFILFQNAFEFAFFFWGLFSYGFSSCLVGRQWMIIVRLIMGVFVQLLCSVSTLPLYALVSQLGTNIRMNVALSEGTVSALNNWRDKARETHHMRAKLGQESSSSSSSHGGGGGGGLKSGADGEHAIDVELPLRGRHANGNSNGNSNGNGNGNGNSNGNGNGNGNGEVNGFHDPDANPKPQGPTDSHSMEIGQQGSKI